MARTRKTPKSWIDAGLSALKKVGAEGLKAESLARDIGTTKGSFYWHFKDVPAYQAAVLDTWADAAQSRFDAVVASSDTPLGQLRALGGYHQSSLDRAVRGWAVHDKSARKAVSGLDRHMTATIKDLLTDQGATHPDFPGLVHAAMMSGTAKNTQAETLIDLLLVLK